MSDRWDDRAACDGLDPVIFFVERGESTTEAKRICAQCPVARPCLEAALDRDEEFGIWGGAGESERRLLTRQFRRGGSTWESAWRNWLGRLRAAVAGESYEVVNRNTDGATCGLRSTYARGCRCRRCTFAAADYTAEEMLAKARARRSAAS